MNLFCVSFSSSIKADNAYQLPKGIAGGIKDACLGDKIDPVISLRRGLSLPRGGPKRILKKKVLQFSGEGSAHSGSLNP